MAYLPPGTTLDILSCSPGLFLPPKFYDQYITALNAVSCLPVSSLPPCFYQRSDATCDILSCPPGRAPCELATPPHPAAGNYYDRVVIIGINYFQQKGELKWCVDRARSMCQYPQQKGLRKENTILLTDDQMNCLSQPTAKNIITALYWLAKNAKLGERLLLYCAGHGRTTPSPNAKRGRLSKRDGQAPQVSIRDDAFQDIYPSDFRFFKQCVIGASAMKEILDPVLKKGARLIVVQDAAEPQV